MIWVNLDALPPGYLSNAAGDVKQDSLFVCLQVLLVKYIPFMSFQSSLVTGRELSQAKSELFLQRALLFPERGISWDEEQTDGVR